MSLLDDMLRIKRDLDAGAPPPMYAVKCHPMTGYRLQREWLAAEPDLLTRLWVQPPIYHDADMPPGQVLVARTRQLADFWRMESQFAYWQRLQTERRRLLTALCTLIDQRTTNTKPKN